MKKRNKNRPIVPTGRFFCKTCKTHRLISDRIGKYGKLCRFCLDGESDDKF